MAHRFNHYLAVLGSCVLLGLAACGSDPQQIAPGGDSLERTPVSGGAAAQEQVGSIELALKVGGAQLDSMSYAIVGSGFTTSGNLDVSHSSSVSGIIGGIPFGNDYALTMSGQGGSAAPLACSGSVSFNLDSVGPVPVTIPISCKQPAVVEPPPTSMPAPVPPFAVFSLACALAALGVVLQRRSARG